MNPHPPGLDAVQGRSEQRSEAYLKYVERVAELLTQQCAKSDGRAAGSASRQAGAAWRLW